MFYNIEHMFDKSTSTRKKILQVTSQLFSLYGYEGVTMRRIAKQAHIAPSVVYYYFEDKDILLRSMFDENNTELGILRAQLPPTKNASLMLSQRIQFQLENAEKIVSVLKYFLTYRKQFHKLPTGFVPEKTYLHIEEAIRYGVSTGEFASQEIQEQAKVITHAINGFVLEYYPDIPTQSELKKLVKTIHKFILRAIRRV